MNNPTVIWRFGEPMERSLKGDSKKYIPNEPDVQTAITDRQKNRDIVNKHNNDFGCVTSNPFFEMKPISEVILEQEEFMRGRPTNKYEI